MTVLCDVLVPGDPVAKGRPRMGKGRTYTPARTEDAEAAMAWALRGAHKGLPAIGPVAVVLRFQCATKRRADVDNLAKLVLDAGNGIVWADDQQIVDLHVFVTRGVSHPSSHVLAWELP